jgi:hypothetical protein
MLYSQEELPEGAVELHNAVSLSTRTGQERVDLYLRFRVANIKGKSTIHFSKSSRFRGGCGAWFYESFCSCGSCIFKRGDLPSTEISSPSVEPGYCSGMNSCSCKIDQYTVYSELELMKSSCSQFWTSPRDKVVHTANSGRIEQH